MTPVVEVAKRLTVKEFRAMEFPENDPYIYELINGELMKRTSPSLSHQRVSRRMTYFLEKFLLENPLGEFFEAPTDVALDENNGVVPDIAYISNERSFICERDDYVAGTPDLIMEIVSPGNVRRDRVTKMDLYERFAVREYWLIDPNNRTVEIYVMRENRFAEHQFLENEGRAVSTVLTGFELDIKDLFER